MSGSPEEFLAKWLPTQAVREAGQHFLGNHTVDVHGDAAHAETYFMASMKDVGSGVLRIVAGRYVDRFQKRAGEWRIAERVVVLDWQCQADASGMDHALAGRVRGVRGPDDPSYRSMEPPLEKGTVR
jgi:aspartate aminotransferase-like enzyme